MNTKHMTPDDVVMLTPTAVVKNVFPHVWDRIMEKLHRPADLDDLLVELILQDRPDKPREGFPFEVLVELNDIKQANLPKLPANNRYWSLNLNA